MLFIASFSQAQKVKGQLHSIVGYGQNEDFAKRAAAAFEKVLNSEEFKTRMLAMTYLKTKGLTNQQLYETIMKAHELERGKVGKTESWI